MYNNFFSALFFLLLSGVALSLAQQPAHPHEGEIIKILREQQERRDFIFNKLADPPAHQSLFTGKVKTLNAIIPDFQVNEKGGPNYADQKYPSISADGSGNFVITWYDNRNGDNDIYAQRYSSDGITVGTNFRVTNTGERKQFAPDVKLWNGRIYNTWEDNRTIVTWYDIWANVLDWENPTRIINPQPLPEPSAFILRQNYPNPFNPSTTIQYELPQDSEVRISIFNILGKRIKVLENSRQQAGAYTVQWDGRDEHGNSQASGIYICRIQAGGFRQSIKLMLVR